MRRRSTGYIGWVGPKGERERGRSICRWMAVCTQAVSKVLREPAIFRIFVVGGEFQHRYNHCLCPIYIARMHGTGGWPNTDAGQQDVKHTRRETFGLACVSSRGARGVQGGKGWQGGTRETRGTRGADRGKGDCRSLRSVAERTDGQDQPETANGLILEPLSPGARLLDLSTERNGVCKVPGLGMNIGRCITY